MKGYYWIPVALLLGLLIGAWPQRAALRKAREEILNLEKTLKERSAHTDQFKSVSRFLRIPDAESRRPRRLLGPARERPAAADPATNAALKASEPTNTPPSRAEFEFRIGNGPRRGRRGQSLETRITEAAEMWRMRSDIARNTFISNAELDDDQAAQFDVLVASMNMRLQDRIEHWADHLQQREEKIDAETGMRVINDLTDAMVVTYDEMDRTLPEGWREESGGSVDLTDFIDPTVATPLIEVEDKLGQGPHGGAAGAK